MTRGFPATVQLFSPLYHVLTQVSGKAYISSIHELRRLSNVRRPWASQCVHVLMSMSMLCANGWEAPKLKGTFCLKMYFDPFGTDM